MDAAKLFEIIKKLAEDLNKDKAQSQTDLLLNEGALKGLSVLISRIEDEMNRQSDESQQQTEPTIEMRWEEQRAAEAEVAEHNEKLRISKEETE